MQLLPNGKQQFIDQNGHPLAGGLVYFYAPGTSNPVTTYQDSAGTIPNTNPVVLDSNGQAIIWGTGTFRQVVKNASGTTIWDQIVAALDLGPNLADTTNPANGDALIGVKQPFANAVGRTQHDKNLELMTLADFTTPAAAALAAAGRRLLINAGETVTLNVPSAFATLQGALSAIAGWIINGTVTIQIADGSYSIGSTISLNHPFGANIQIVGNAASPDNVILMGPNPPTFDLFSIGGGHQFGLIQGVHASLPAKAAAANNFTAFVALDGACLNINACKSNNWYYAFATRDGGTMVLSNSVADSAGDVGVWAFGGGRILASNVQSNNASDTANGLGFGFQAEFGGVILATNCSATGNNIAGFAGLSNGTCRYYSCTANANIGHGFESRGGGQIEANGSSSTNNGGYGLYVTEYGNITGLTTNTGNTAGPANAFAYFDTSTGNARVAASVGQLRLDTNDTNSVFFNTVGGLQAEVRHQAAAANHVYFQGGATGSPVVLGAAGADAIVDLALYPQGDGGYLRFGAGYFAGAPSPNGFFSVKLNDGSIVKVPCLK
ncbi:right-handed parallel beta-helix repeat-containing protein [Burkholderia cenocepacia]|uniref:right-handed parallel beta-helix repeat-containing protein n=1 Tax=Burkholderia cenocepacia TaxID=95486 RepID=UPI0028B32CF8|nr:right-handed parallel beta-helix repeat-containing protein [Burkholderia cenocepacia]MDT6993225.1 right-handed parallel beta-helix repeat-containing protein [Burkholderia cenocepacia]